LRSGGLIGWILEERAERDLALLATWTASSVLRRERVLILSDEISEDTLRTALRARHVDPRPYQRERLLMLASARQELQPEGRVQPTEVATLLQSEAQVARTMGHRGLRVCLDSRSLPRLLDDTPRLLKLLEALQEHCNRTPSSSVLVCYGPGGMPAEALTAVIHGHEQLIAGGRAFANPAHLPPDQQAGEEGARRLLRKRLTALRDASRGSADDRDEASFRTLMDGLPVAVMYVDPRGLVRYASPDVERFFGAPPKRLVGVHALELLAPEERQRGSKALGDMVTQQTRRGPDVYMIMQANGQRRQVEVHAASHVDRRGVLRGVSVVVADVGQAREVARDLKRRNRFQQSLLDAIPMPVFFKDTRGLYLGCNEAFARMLALEREQIVGRSVFDIAPEDLARTYHARDSELLAKPGEQVYEAEVVDGGGTRRQVIFHKATFPDERGDVGGLIGTIVDATDLRGAERALRESEARLQRVNEELERRAEDRAAELQVVHRLAGELGFVRTPADLAWLVLEELQRVVPHDLVGLMLQEHGGPKVYMRGHSYVDPALVRQVEQELTIAGNGAVPGPGIRLSNSASQELRTFTPPGGEATLPVAAFGTEVRVPLRAREGQATQGMLYVGASTGDAIDEDQGRLLRIVAHQAAEALGRIRVLLDEEQQRVENIVRHLPCGVLLLDGDHRIRFLNPRAKRYLPALTLEREGDQLTRLGSLLVESLVPDGREVEVGITPPGGEERTFAVNLVAIDGPSDPSQAQTMVMIRDESERAEQRRRESATPSGCMEAQQTGELAVVRAERSDSPLDRLLVERGAVHAEESNTMRLAMAQLRGWETVLLVSTRSSPRGATARSLRELGYKVIGVPDCGRARAVGEDHRGPLHLLVVDLDLPPDGGPALLEQISQLRPALKALYVVQRDARGGGTLPRGAAALVAPFAPSTLARKVREILDERG